MDRLVASVVSSIRRRENAIGVGPAFEGREGWGMGGGTRGDGNHRTLV